MPEKKSTAKSSSDLNSQQKPEQNKSSLPKQGLL